MQLTIFTRSLCILLIVGPFFLTANGFFFDKLERFKKFTLPGYASSLGFPFSGMSNQGVRVCINFNSNLNYPQGYQQATYCTGQTTIPSNINYTQANCIMNSCQPAYGSGPRFPSSFLSNK
ncbi:hypothetical protein TYRP_001789 [Tyrophagus putrescentiae]|nr:hypothetical protein TYRP_001789 [Tyrophagus putrescentiae]